MDLPNQLNSDVSMSKNQQVENTPTCNKNVDYPGMACNQCPNFSQVNLQFNDGDTATLPQYRHDQNAAHSRYFANCRPLGSQNNDQIRLNGVNQPYRSDSVMKGDDVRELKGLKDIIQNLTSMTVKVVGQMILLTSIWFRALTNGLKT